MESYHISVAINLMLTQVSEYTCMTRKPSSKVAQAILKYLIF